MLRLAPAKFESNADKNHFDTRGSIALLAKWPTVLRQQVGTEITIGIDHYTRLSAAETYSFIKRMPPGTIDFIEEPIRDESTEASKSLCKMIDVPFAIGEEFSSKWQFQPFLEKNLTQYARIDVCNIGGITEAMKVAAMAEAHYIDLMPHNPLGPICTAATIHVAAACTNFSWLEEVNTSAQQMGTNDRKYYPVQPELKGSRYPLPETLGLGVEFDEDYAMKQTFKPVEIPRLCRSNSSFTNW